VTFEKFNEAARRALFFARYEAGALGEHHLGSEHLLLGVIRERDVVSTRVWGTLGVDAEAIRRKYPPLQSPAVSSSAELPLSEHARKVLAYTLHEAEGRQSPEVAPHHLLLAILRVPECRGARELAEAGVNYHAVAEAIEPIEHELKLRERTPLTLRRSHYELLDHIASSMALPAGHRATREGLALAVFDALAASGIRKHVFGSSDDFRTLVEAALAARWPKP
jgi:ATP-dependent Clp protease ATP-binding subunit ClpA